MTDKQPRYEEFLSVANTLVEQGILITVNNIKAHLGRGSSTLLQTYMIQRERERNAATAIFGGKISDKLALAIAYEFQTAIQLSTQKFEEKSDQERQEKREIQSQLAETQVKLQRRESEQLAFTQERKAREAERLQMLNTLEAAQKQNEAMAKVITDLLHKTKSDALIEQIEHVLQQFESAIACKREISPKNRYQSYHPSELTKKEDSRNPPRNRPQRKKKKRKKKARRSP